MSEGVTPQSVPDTGAPSLRHERVRGHALAVVLAVALLARLVPVVLADRVTADIARYERVGAHVLDTSWDPYQAPRLYPYPPVWVWVEAASLWIARWTGASFPVIVKLPVVAADLGIVYLLAALGTGRGLGLLPAWLYALHPVSVLVTGFHGQFDAVALLLVLVSLRAWERSHLDRSALALAAGIGVKSFPVLLLPFFLARAPSRAAASRFFLLALAPVALLLLPFTVHDRSALSRELLGYGGVADFGWIGVLRGLRWLTGAGLHRSEARYWGALAVFAKGLFLLAYAAILMAFWRGRLQWSLARASLAVLLAFPTLYGLVSAQYLLWPVPLAALFPDRHGSRYALAATAALLGFYLFLHPAVLLPDHPLVGVLSPQAGTLWVIGAAGLLYVGLTWLAALVSAGLARPA